MDLKAAPKGDGRVVTETMSGAYNPTQLGSR
jgi:hypothetical protein